MSHFINHADRDLHWPDGTHRATPASTNGKALANHERRLVEHLALHDRELEATTDLAYQEMDDDDDG